jgi:hypothetical protein
VGRQVAIKDKYKLTVTRSEKEALVAKLSSASCGGSQVTLYVASVYKVPKPKPEGEPKATPKPKPKPTPKPKPKPEPKPETDPNFDSCAEAKRRWSGVLGRSTGAGGNSAILRIAVDGELTVSPIANLFWNARERRLRAGWRLLVFLVMVFLVAAVDGRLVAGLAGRLRPL